MQKSFGYMGKILWVNLTKHEFREEFPTEEIYRKYLGGYGLGIYYIYRNIKPNCDPLGPDNIIGFIPGLFTGSIAPFTGRFMVCAKSPLTGKGVRTNGEKCSGGWGDSNSGGFFGPAIKRAGYDALFFVGCSEKPVYLLITGDKKELVDATDLWGKDALETDEILKKKYKGARVSAIGVAGEKKSLIAGIVNDGGRIAARSGLGAVMGSKNIKALCLVGKTKLEIADKQTATTLTKQYRENLKQYLNSKPATAMLKSAPKISFLLRWMRMGMFGNEGVFSQYFHGYGTSYSTAISAEIGDMPIKNYKGVGYLDYPQSIARDFAGHNLIQYKIKPFGCFSCPVQCGAILSVPEIGLKETHRPEYETLGAFGGLILNKDINVLFELNEYLNREGMDTISAGGTVAFVVECVEQGILTKEDFKCEEYPEGFLPQWNTSDYIMPLLRLMVTREGIGNLLADGTRVASEKLSKLAKSFAINANGQELPMHDARLMPGLMLTYLTDPTPGRHTAACLDFASMGPHNNFMKGISFKNSKNPSKKGKYQAEFAKFKQTFNALGFCEFAVWNGEYPMQGLLKAIFDWDMTPEEFLEIGHRIQTLRQMFNAREGAIRHEIPKRAIGDPPLKKGPLRGNTLHAEEMAQSYYNTIGFAKNGIPRKDTLNQLNLEFAINDLPSCTGVPNELINSTLLKKTEDSNIHETQIISDGPQQININLTGTFGGKSINEENIFNFNHPPRISDILLKINQKYELNFFTANAVKTNQIAILLNGQRLDSRDLSTKIYKSDVISIVQPIIGG